MLGTSDSFIVLNGVGSTIILELSPTRAPIWRYWGDKLPEGTLPPCRLADERPVPTFSLDENVPATLFPTFGIGWFGAPALLAHRDGQAFAQNFTQCTIVWIRTNEAVKISLVDDVAHLHVEINIDLNAAYDTITYQTRLTNLGLGLLDVIWLAAACLPIPARAHTVRSYTGRHNHEFELSVDDLSRATWLRENRRGLTSHDCLPASVITLPETTQHSGPAYGAQLAWSGNHTQRLDYNDDGNYQWQWGEWLAPGEVRLAQEQFLDTPDVIATFSATGLNGIAQNFYGAIRARIKWPSGHMKPRPVHLNTWEGVYFDLNEPRLMDMATAAADLGIERFVVDDGWFHARRNDRAGLGDWWVDPDVFPDGLLPLARHVTGLGMEFGLWIEPEMVNPDSDLFRAHPDWALQLAGRPHLTARHQLVLDISKPEVFDYLREKLTALLNSLPISYLKWDHNRDLTSAGSAGAPAYRNQVIAAYKLFDTIRESWPHIEIEACAGGGGRIDAGILKYVHRFWTSDCIDAVSRVSMQRGFLQFFPPEIMGSHIGASPAHATGRQQELDFRAAVAMSGHFGLELDPRHLSQDHRGKVRNWVTFYKRVRDTLHTGTVWQGEGHDGMSWQVHGVPQDCVLFAFRTAPTSQRFPPRLRLPFLDPNLSYEITALAPDLPPSGVKDGAFGRVSEGPLIISGAWLVQAGLTLPPMAGEAAIIYRLKALR